MPDRVIGREPELAAAGKFIAQLERGPAVLVYAGEPGIGKTAVWQEAGERARASSLLLLSARPVEAEAGLAFSALADLLESVVDESWPALPEPQRRALAVALLREAPGPGRFDQRAVAAATRTVLQTLATKRPVVVAIDDLQWLDRPSARVLEFAIRRLHDLPVGVLASERVEPASKLPLALENVVPGDRLRRVQLGPLSLAALHQLLKERLGRSFTRRVIVRIESATGGNPFFALELGRSLPEDAQAGLGTLPMPGRLLEVVEARVMMLSQRARLPLLAAAALRSPTANLVAAATDQTPGEAHQALERAEELGIIDLAGSQLRFTHPLFAAAVYASAPPAQRRQTHRRIARLTEDLEERVRHLALGTAGADAELAATLEAAAEHARSRGAPESAAELVEWARTLTPPEMTADIQRRTVQAAEYRFHAGELRPARELLEAVLEGAPAGPTRAAALRLLGEICYHDQSVPEAVGLFVQALDHVGNDHRAAAAIELRLAFSFRGLGDFARAEPHTRRALALAEQLGEPGPLAEALALMVRLDFLMGRGLDEPRLNRALELEDRHRQVTMQLRPSVIAADLLLYAGELQRSVLILERERKRVFDRGEESDLPFVSSRLAWAECWRGRLDLAITYANEALETAELAGSAFVRCLALVFAALVAAHRGEAARARELAEEGLSLAELIGWSIAAVWGNWALGGLETSLADARAVNDALGSLTAAVEEEGLAEPIRAMFLADEIEALITLGDIPRAERLIDMLEEAATAVQRGWALVQAGRCRALLLAARGDLDRAAQVAHEALAVGEDLQLRLELARTFLVAGQIERRRRRKRPARDLLERALEIFEAAGASIWAQRASVELDRAVGRPTGVELTASELRVARLAASGLTNREVAAQLFMSPKTVEANLGRVYRKLGIHSRAQLGARLGVGGTAAKS
jgi:DNA-binding CsgD family transcriptional regulator